MHSYAWLGLPYGWTKLALPSIGTTWYAVVIFRARWFFCMNHVCLYIRTTWDASDQIPMVGYMRYWSTLSFAGTAVLQESLSITAVFRYPFFVPIGRSVQVLAMRMWKFDHSCWSWCQWTWLHSSNQEERTFEIPTTADLTSFNHTPQKMASCDSNRKKLLNLLNFIINYGLFVCFFYNILLNWNITFCQ